MGGVEALWVVRACTAASWGAVGDVAVEKAVVVIGSRGGCSWLSVYGRQTGTAAVGCRRHRCASPAMCLTPDCTTTQTATTPAQCTQAPL